MRSAVVGKIFRRMELGSGLGFGGAGLADHALDRVGRLGTDGEPLVGEREIDVEVGAFLERIVGAELLDVAAVAALAAVHGNDFVIRAVLGALAVESDGYGHGENSMDVCPAAGGGGNWRIPAGLPSRILAKFTALGRSWGNGFGDCDEELGFAAGHGGDGDGAAVGFDGALDDGEAEAGAFDFLLRVVFFHPVETAEDVRQVGARDADAVVRHPDPVVVVARCSQPISTRRPGWGFCLRAFSTRLKSTWVQ